MIGASIRGARSMHGLVFSILLIIVGALAAYPAVVQTWPRPPGSSTSWCPIKGWLGIVALVWGLIWGLRLLAVAGLMMLLRRSSGWSAWRAEVVAVLLGLILGYGLIAQYLLSNKRSSAAGREWRAKLLARQVALGWAAIVLGAVNFLLFLVR